MSLNQTGSLASGRGRFQTCNILSYPILSYPCGTRAGVTPRWARSLSSWPERVPLHITHAPPKNHGARRLRGTRPLGAHGRTAARLAVRPFLFVPNFPRAGARPHLWQRRARSFLLLLCAPACTLQRRRGSRSTMPPPRFRLLRARSTLPLLVPAPLERCGSTAPPASWQAGPADDAVEGPGRELPARGRCGRGSGAAAPAGD